MLRPLMLFLALLTVSLCADAQTFWVDKTPLFDFLYQLKKPISEISNTNDQQILPIKIYELKSNQKIIKNNNGLFILIDGSGQVYKATSIKEDKISFTRVDSTIYSGNSFNSYSFSYKDTLYNFGGYGFWRVNGLLSYFKEGYEWNIVKINKEYHAVDVLHKFSPDLSTLYYVQRPNKVEFTSDIEPELPLVIRLDLTKKENTVLGALTKKIDFPDASFFININSLQGVLVVCERESFLLNFTKNTVYKLTNTKFINEFFNHSHNDIKNTFEIDHKLYYTFEPDHTLHSLDISLNDFKLEPYPLYVPINSAENYLFLFIGIFAVLLLALIYLIRLKKGRRDNLLIKEGILADSSPNSNSLVNGLHFSSLEQELISKMIIKSLNKNLFTVDEMNTALGLGRKSMEIQKKIRAESINRINHKFKVNFNQEIDLIDRVRSEEDRRYFHYSISEINALIYRGEGHLK